MRTCRGGRQHAFLRRTERNDQLLGAVTSGGKKRWAGIGGNPDQLPLRVYVTARNDLEFDVVGNGVLRGRVVGKIDDVGVKGQDGCRQPIVNLEIALQKQVGVGRRRNTAQFNRGRAVQQ